MKTRLKMGTILDIVSEHYEVSKKDLTDSSRRAKLTKPRHMAMYLAYKHTSCSNNIIAGYFNREESTVRVARYGIRDCKMLADETARLDKACLDALRMRQLKEEYKTQRLMKSRRVSRTPFVVLRRGGGVLRRKHVYGGGK